MSEIKYIELPKSDKRIFEFEELKKKLELEIQELFFVPEEYLILKEINKSFKI